jgi:hypothetical protein
MLLGLIHSLEFRKRRDRRHNRPRVHAGLVELFDIRFGDMLLSSFE